MPLWWRKTQEMLLWDFRNRTPQSSINTTLQLHNTPIAWTIQEVLTIISTAFLLRRPCFLSYCALWSDRLLLMWESQTAEIWSFLPRIKPLLIHDSLLFHCIHIRRVRNSFLRKIKFWIIILIISKIIFFLKFNYNNYNKYNFT